MKVPGPKTTMYLQRATFTSDSVGGESATWATIQTMRGVLYSTGGDETLDKEKKTVNIPQGFICNNYAIVPTEMDRMLDTYGNIYEILFVDRPQFQHFEIKLKQWIT